MAEVCTTVNVVYDDVLQYVMDNRGVSFIDANEVVLEEGRNYLALCKGEYNNPKGIELVCGQYSDGKLFVTEDNYFNRTSIKYVAR